MNVPQLKFQATALVHRLLLSPKNRRERERENVNISLSLFRLFSALFLCPFSDPFPPVSDTSGFGPEAIKVLFARIIHISTTLSPPPKPARL